MLGLGTPARRPRGGKRRIESGYALAQRFFRRLREIVVPCAQRVLRFFALRYCYPAQIDWPECAASRLQVPVDLLHVFFGLKYYRGRPAEGAQAQLRQRRSTGSAAKQLATLYAELAGRRERICG